MRIAQPVDRRFRPAHCASLRSADDVTDDQAHRMRPAQIVANWSIASPVLRLKSAPVLPDPLPVGAVKRGIAPVSVATALPRHTQILELK